MAHACTPLTFSINSFDKNRDITDPGPRASIPMGQGGHVPPIFGLGGHDHECPPPPIFLE